jgi:hypothetical protein
MPPSKQVGQPMHSHGRVQGVRVEAKVELGLEEGQWTVGRTGELRPAAMAGAAGGSALRSGEYEGGGACGSSGGLLARMHASWLGQPGRGARGAARGQRRRPNGAARPATAHARCVCARGRGPDHDGQRVVHAVTAYGRRALWAQRGRRRGADGATSRAERAPGFQPAFVSLRPPLTDSNLKTLN